MPNDSSPRQDLLKAVYVMAAEGGSATNARLADHLRISPPSVSGAVRRLVRDGLAEVRPERGVCLTPTGQAAALAVIRRHRLVETLLVEVLGMGWDEVHQEAELLEHAVSDRLAAVLDRALGHPQRDPHGDPIPQLQCEHHERHGRSVADAAVGTTVLIDRVSDHDVDALRELAAIGAVPGAELAVVDRGPFGDPTWIVVNGIRHAMGTRLAGCIFGGTIQGAAR